MGLSRARWEGRHPLRSERGEKQLLMPAA